MKFAAASFKPSLSHFVNCSCHSFGLLCFDEAADEAEKYVQSMRSGLIKIGYGKTIIPQAGIDGFIITNK